MICRASMPSSRTVILLPGSGRPLELAKVDLVRPSSRARVVISLGKGALAAGHALGQDHAAVVAALDDGAAQEVGDRDAAVDGGEHGRGAGRRAALAPGILADPVFVGELDVARGQRVEHHFDGHQLHHAGGRAELVGVLLEQHAAAARLDQDRGRRVGVETAVFATFLAPCTLWLAACDADRARRRTPPGPRASARTASAASRGVYGKCEPRMPWRCPE